MTIYIVQVTYKLGLIPLQIHMSRLFMEATMLPRWTVAKLGVAFCLITFYVSG